MWLVPPVNRFPQLTTVPLPFLYPAVVCPAGRGITEQRRHWHSLFHPLALKLPGAFLSIFNAVRYVMFMVFPPTRKLSLGPGVLGHRASPAMGGGRDLMKPANAAYYRQTPSRVNGSARLSLVRNGQLASTSDIIRD